MPTKVFKFRIEFITSEEDVDDEVIGIVSHDKKMVEFMAMGSNGYFVTGFIPFTAIKKLEILEEVGVFD
jgi:hypothetical protein